MFHTKILEFLYTFFQKIRLQSLAMLQKEGTVQKQEKADQKSGQSSEGGQDDQKKLLEEAHKEAAKEEIKEEDKAQRRLEELIEESGKIIFKAKAAFPFDFFPDKITINTSFAH